MRGFLAIVVMLWACQAMADCGLPETAIKKAMIAESLANYPGNCPCPYNADRRGRACGGRSAYSRPGGYAPLCYDSDISSEAAAAWCRSH